MLKFIPKFVRLGLFAAIESKIDEIDETDLTKLKESLKRRLKKLLGI